MLEEEISPLVDSFDSLVPEGFRDSFHTVFGSLEKEDEVIIFLDKINKRMEEEKGNGIIKAEEILYLRGEWSNGNPYSYNKHHVIPLSRDKSRTKMEMRGELVWVPEVFHAAWHIIFQNLYDEETILFLEMLFSSFKLDIQMDYDNLQGLIANVKSIKCGRV